MKLETKWVTKVVGREFVSDLDQLGRLDHSLSYFSFQPVLHDWFNKGRGMCYPVCGMVHIKTLAANQNE